MSLLLGMASGGFLALWRKRKEVAQGPASVTAAGNRQRSRGAGFHVAWVLGRGRDGTARASLVILAKARSQSFHPEVQRFPLGPRLRGDDGGGGDAGGSG